MTVIEKCIECGFYFWVETMVQMPHPKDEGGFMCEFCFEKICDNAWESAVKFIRENTRRITPNTD